MLGLSPAAGIDSVGFVYSFANGTTESALV